MSCLNFRLRTTIAAKGAWLYAMLLLVASTGHVSAGIIHTATFNGHTYHLLDTDGTKWWLEAEAEAVTLGGHLVTINDAAENDWVYDTFAPLATSYAGANGLPDQGAISLWIGFSDHEVEGTWKWVSGEPVGYTNWKSGEPAGNFGDEDFAGIAVNFFGPRFWHDIVGNARFADLPFGVVEVNGLQAVPEPSSLTLAGIGLLSFCLAHRRRRNHRKSMRSCVCLMLSLIALGFADPSPAPAGAIYDVAGDFSATNNPNLPWIIGSSSTLGGTLTPFTRNDPLFADGTNARIDQWFASQSASGPLVTHNGNATWQIYGGTMLWDPGQFAVAPGTPDYVVTRFVTPVAGQYTLNALFEGMQFVGGTTTDVHILLNGNSLFAGRIEGFAGRPYFGTPRFGSSPDQSYAAVLTLGTGDTLDFAVGNGGNGQGGDGTGLSARLTAVSEPTAAVPEPSTLVLCATGGLLLGLRRRHGRVRQT